jgi:hypothetical protein
MYRESIDSHNGKMGAGVILEFIVMYYCIVGLMIVCDAHLHGVRAYCVIGIKGFARGIHPVLLPRVRRLEVNSYEANM